MNWSVVISLEGRHHGRPILNLLSKYISINIGFCGDHRTFIVTESRSGFR